MKKVEITEASKHYVSAHAVHYKTKDLGEALKQYSVVIDSYPQTQEAVYSRSQIQNIVSAVVPKEELFDVHLKLAIIHLTKEGQPTVEAVTVDDSRN